MNYQEVSIPAFVFKTNKLTPFQMIVFGEILRLLRAGNLKYCTHHNRHFAEKFNVHKGTISRAISALSDYRFIRLEFIGENEKQRRIYIDYITI